MHFSRAETTKQRWFGLFHSSDNQTDAFGRVRIVLLNHHGGWGRTNTGSDSALWILLSTSTSARSKRTPSSTGWRRERGGDGGWPQWGMGSEQRRGKQSCCSRTGGACAREPRQIRVKQALSPLAFTYHTFPKHSITVDQFIQLTALHGR